MGMGIKKISELILQKGRALLVTDSTKPNKLEPGTIKIDPNNGEMFYKNSQKPDEWTKFEGSSILEKESIDNSLIKNNTITGEKIAENTIEGKHLKDKSITGNKIADKTIKNINFDNDCVNTNNLIDFSVTNTKIAGSAISFSKLNDDLKARCNEVYILKRSNLDDEGIFIQIEHYTLDGKLSLRSVLTEGDSPFYTKARVTLFKEDGKTIDAEYNIPIKYNEDGYLI